MAVRVLIVDDQAAFRWAARAVIEETEGFEVVAEAASGEESVALARVLRPDLVLMDIRLPGVSGLEATRQILGADGNLPVVFLLSTYEVPDYAALLEECGASAFLPKWEFGPEALSSAWGAATGVIS